ncbi:MAG: hypothetical protein WD096_10445 [Actinomycetota bacterium]
MNAESDVRRVRTADLLLVAMSVMSVGAAAIHFSVIGTHLDEYVWFGVFFAVAAWYQALWAIAVVASPTRRRLIRGLVANVVILVVWLASRTIGLPFGPEPGEVEPVGTADLIATALEVLIVAGCGVGIAREAGRARWTQRRSFSVICAVFGLCSILVATIALASVEGGGAEHTTTAEGAEDTPADGVTLPDQPLLEKLDLGEGRTMQALVDLTSAPGDAQIHLTYFDDAGGELNMGSMTLTASQDGSSVAILVSQLEPGHFFATGSLGSGAWTLLIDGVTASGDVITGSFDVDVP